MINYKGKGNHSRIELETIIEQQIKSSYLLISKARNEGTLNGLKLCKEEWAQGTISHESIVENESYFNALLNETIEGYNNFVRNEKLEDEKG